MGALGAVMVTGGNRGIRLGRARGDNVLALCRTASAALERPGVEAIKAIDVSDSESLGRLKTALNGRTIDVLINYAGTPRPNLLREPDYGHRLEQYRVDALGPLRVTEALLENLVRSSKVVINPSRVASRSNAAPPAAITVTAARRPPRT